LTPSFSAVALNADFHGALNCHTAEVDRRCFGSRSRSGVTGWSLLALFPATLLGLPGASRSPAELR